MSAAHKTNPKLCELPSVMQLISIFQVDEINSTNLIDKLINWTTANGFAENEEVIKKTTLQFLRFIADGQISPSDFGKIKKWLGSRGLIKVKSGEFKNVKGRMLFSHFWEGIESAITNWKDFFIDDEYYKKELGQAVNLMELFPKIGIGYYAKLETMGPFNFRTWPDYFVTGNIHNCNPSFQCHIKYLEAVNVEFSYKSVEYQYKDIPILGALLDSFNDSRKVERMQSAADFIWKILKGLIEVRVVSEKDFSGDYVGGKKGARFDNSGAFWNPNQYKEIKSFISQILTRLREVKWIELDGRYVSAMEIKTRKCVDALCRIANFKDPKEFDVVVGLLGIKTQGRPRLVRRGRFAGNGREQRPSTS